MRKKNIRVLLAGLLIVSAAATAQIVLSQDDDQQISAKDVRKGGSSPSFQRVSTLANYHNNGPANIDETTVSEIVAATRDGKTLVYTDSPSKSVLSTSPIRPTRRRLA
jgi:hypothetical protein